MSVVKELTQLRPQPRFQRFSISKGKALGTRLLQSASSDFVWAHASPLPYGSVTNHVKIIQCLIRRLIGWLRGQKKPINQNCRFFSTPYSIPSYLVVTFQVALS